MHRIFLLSPANCTGKRADLLFNPRAQFDLALRLRQGGGVALADVFRFLSGLYFRGKIAYANRFAAAPPGCSGAWIITAGNGLMPAHAPVSLPDLAAFRKVAVDPAVPAYSRPLMRDIRQLSNRAGAGCEVILLGSISTGKYVDVLLPVLCDRLKFPIAFVGRGDMSRGGLMLRCAADGCELEYAPLHGAVRKGARPPRLEPRRWGFKLSECLQAAG